MKTVAHNVLVTGANGFVGKALCELLFAHGMTVTAAIRNEASMQNDRFSSIPVGDIDGNTRWDEALKNIDCVVHLAARVHVMKETASSPLAEFRRVNCDGSGKLARDAAAAGVKRLIYLSTIKVNGELTDGEPFTEQVNSAPLDPYGVSKWEAENLLRQTASETGMEVVIIRPPLVYGPGVKGNFLTLLKSVSKGVPLPFALVNNRRSLVALGNLVDMIRECVANPMAANETFLVSDGEDLSTAELIKCIAKAMGRSPRLLPLPPQWLIAGASIAGKKVLADRLLGSLQVDSGKAARVLGWQPPQTVAQGIARVVDWYEKRG